MTWLAMAGIRILRRSCGRTRPGRVLGDKAYSNRPNRARLDNKGWWPPKFDPETYKGRNVYGSATPSDDPV